MLIITIRWNKVLQFLKKQKMSRFCNFNILFLHDHQTSLWLNNNCKMFSLQRSLKEFYNQSNESSNITAKKEQRSLFKISRCSRRANHLHLLSFVTRIKNVCNVERALWFPLSSCPTPPTTASLTHKRGRASGHTDAKPPRPPKTRVSKRNNLQTSGSKRKERRAVNKSERDKDRAPRQSVLSGKDRLN